MSTLTHTITAKHLFRQDWAPSDSAEAVARDALALLHAGHRVVISFAGLRGVSSSYFNALLLGLRAALPISELRARVEYQTDGKAQREILQRSIDAVLRDEPS